MKVLYYDCFCGISGDMNLGALIDVGVDKEYLIKELSKLKLDSEYKIVIKKETKMGIMGTKVDVVLKNDGHNHDHIHRNLGDIENIINASTLDERVKKTSLDIFIQVARAEAKIHGKPVNEVHFHEVGAVDSIIDIVGAAVALDYLKVDKIMASPVQVGGGFVKCAHGILPVPAPAAVEILKGIPIKSGIVQFETATPTGAAILAANAQVFTDKIDFTIEKIGYGIGSRDLDIPNVLRVYLGTEAVSEKSEDQYMLETNIDDMNPELYGYIEEKLLKAGALDVYKTPIIMKKGRPAVKLSVLVDRDRIKEVQDIIFLETTSAGIRKYKVDKVMLDRDFSKVKTRYGEITVKNLYHQGKLIRQKPEYEDCKRAAGENGIAISEVYKEIGRLIVGHDDDRE